MKAENNLVISVSLDEVEKNILLKLTELQGVGRATAVKMLIREVGPSKIAEIKSKIDGIQSSVTNN